VINRDKYKVGNNNPVYMILGIVPEGRIKGIHSFDRKELGFTENISRIIESTNQFERTQISCSSILWDWNCGRCIKSRKSTILASLGMVSKDRVRDQRTEQGFGNGGQEISDCCYN